MNYLAHIFLSGADKKLQIGNFIGDAVKGSSYKDFPQPVADGILLHRAIDARTDAHPAVKERIRLLRSHFGRYSGIILDIYFDHLLASRFSEFSNVPLKRFTRGFYMNMICSRKCLPPRIKRFMWHFILSDRLSRYATTDGIAESLEIMVTYRQLDIRVETAIIYLNEHEEELLAVFRPFMEEMQAFCSGYITADDRVLYLREFTSP